MYNFLQFRNTNNWAFDVSPYLDVIYTDFIHLKPNEWYLQRIDLTEPITSVDLFNCVDESCFQYTIVEDSEGRKYINFKISSDSGLNELHRLVINGNLYSNYFICTEEDLEFTSLIHYKDNLTECNCEEDEVYYQNIRLKIVKLDVEDSDSADEYFELSTGNTRLSRVLQKEFEIFEIQADEHVNSAFKNAYNSNYFYINNQRYSKKSAFNRERVLEASNISVSEFSLNKVDGDVLSITNNLFTVPEQTITKFVNFNSDTNSNVQFTSNNYTDLQIVTNSTYGTETVVNGVLIIDYNSQNLIEATEIVVVNVLNSCGDVVEKITYEIIFKDQANKAPVAVIDNNPTSTVLLTDVLILYGDESYDLDGAIVSYLWEKISGGAATIVSPSSETTDVNNLEEGTYVFRLTVTDNNGATGHSEVTVIVTSANNYLQYEIAVANCSLANPNTVAWTTVYTSDTDVIEVGTILYTDQALTTPYLGNGFGTNYRIRTIDNLIYNFSYTMDAGDGSITSETSCNNGGGNPTGNLVINSSQPQITGLGTLSFTGGEPNEVLDLDFTLTLTGASTGNNSISFSNPVNVQILDSLHLNRSGTVTLDSNGNATSNYTIQEGELSCLVTITGRSSAVAIPTNDSTTIDMPNLVVI